MLAFSLAIFLLSIMHVTAAEEARWSSFRGCNRDGHSIETGLLQKWPKGGPKLLWTCTDIGSGHSSTVADHGLVYTSGVNGLFAIDVETGKTRWRQRAHSSATPSVRDGRVFMQANGTVFCFEALTGKPLWKQRVMPLTSHPNFKDRTRYGSWHGSPVIADGKVIVVTGHPTTPVLALDAGTGNLLWASSGSTEASSRGWSSPVVAKRGNTDLVVAQTAWHVLGLDLSDGRVHWEFDIYPNGNGRRAGNSLANVPVVVGDLIYTCGAGFGQAFSLSADAKTAAKLWGNGVIRPLQDSVLHVNGMIFGRAKAPVPWAAIDASPALKFNGVPFVTLAGKFHSRPKQSDSRKPSTLRVLDQTLGESIKHGVLVCQDLKTGVVHGVRGHRFPRSLYGGAMLLFADGRIYCAWSGSGVPTVYLLSPDADMRMHGRFRPSVPTELARSEDWKCKGYNAPAIYRKRLLIRYADRLFAYDIARANPVPSKGK